MMGNLPIGVPPPTMQGLLMQQQMMAIPTSAAQGFPPGAIMPPMSVAGGGPGMRVNYSLTWQFFKKWNIFWRTHKILEKNCCRNRGGLFTEKYESEYGSFIGGLLMTNQETLGKNVWKKSWWWKKKNLQKIMKV